MYNCLWKRLSFLWKIFSIGNLASPPLSATEGSSLKNFSSQVFMPLLFCARICQDKLSGQNCFVAVISYQAAGEAWAETGYNWFNGWAIELTQRKYLAGSVFINTRNTKTNRQWFNSWAIEMTHRQREIGSWYKISPHAPTTHLSLSCNFKINREQSSVTKWSLKIQ